MVSIGGNIRPFVGDSSIQNVSGMSSLVIAPVSGVGAITSGHGSGAIGGALVSGNICYGERGFIAFQYSGQVIWLPYWVSA